MGIVNIADIEDTIRDYMCTRLNQYYPEIDTSKNSVFDNIFMEPLITILNPLINNLSRLELMTNIMENAENLTEEDLNEIGENNYFMSRKSGRKASTALKLTFANLPISEPYFKLIIPPGTTFSTGSGLEYQTITQTTIEPAQLKTMYNPNKYCYEVYVTVYAKEMGIDYNVAAGEITILNTYFSNFFVSCINTDDVTNGTNSESNTDYAKRIREFYLTRQLGTAPGYRAFIMERFEEVRDVLVQGYKDDYMMRDIVMAYDPETHSTKEIHIGGKVDLYIRGCNYEEIAETVNITNNIIILDHSPEELGDDMKKSISLYNLTDPSTTLSFEVLPVGEDEFFNHFKDKVKVIIDADGYEHLEVKLAVSFKRDGVTFTDEIYKTIELTHFDTNNISVINSISDEDGNVLDIPGHTQIITTGEKETTQEKNRIAFTNLDSYVNGDTLKISFTRNKTLNEINRILNEEENRIITADIVAKLATPAYINLQMTIKVANLYSKYDEEVVQNRIRSSIINYLDKHKLGSSVNASDIISWLYVDESVKDIIRYISVPFDVFYIAHSVNDEIDARLNVEDTLPIRPFEYPVLNNLKFKATLE